MPIKFLNDVAVDTSVLYVDTINDKVGIGTAGPQAKLHIDAPTGDFLKISESGTDRLTLDSNNEMVLTSPSNWGGYFKVGKNVGPYEVAIELGEGRTANGLSRIDLVGDTTYADYGFRIIRNNGGANTTSQLVHRGTGNFELVSTDSGDIILNPNNGNVGIGTTSPDSKLHIVNPDGGSYRFGYGGSSDVYFDSDTVYFRTDNGGANLMTSTVNGLGIGTTSPDTKLDVVGRAVIGTGNTLTNATNATVIGNSNNLTSDSIVDSNTNLVLGDYGAGRYANTVISDRTLRLGRADVIADSSSNTTGILNFNDSVQANSAFSNVGGFVGYFPPPTTTNDYYFISAFSENVNGSAFQTGASPTASRMNISMSPSLDCVSYKFDSNTSVGGGVYYTASQNNANPSSRGIFTFDARHQNQNYAAPDGHALFEVTSGYGQTKFIIKQVSGSSNVGIGTTSPSEKLDVNGNISVSGNINLTDGAIIGVNGGETFTVGKITGGGTANLTLGTNTTVTGNFTINNGVGLQFGSGANKLIANTGSTFQFDKTGGGVANYEFTSNVGSVTFLNTGNVGIGTNSPSQKLHVSGNARVTGAYYDSNNSPGTSNQVLVSTVTGTDWIDGSAIPGVPDGSGTANYTARWIDTDTLGIGVLYDNGTNVGIGTTSPSRALEINTTGSTDYQFRIGTSAYYYDIGRNTSNGFLNFYGNQSNASGFVFETVNGERMRIDNDGNVGIGTTSPGEKLTINGTDQYVATQQASYPWGGSVTLGLRMGTDATAGLLDFRRWTGTATTHGTALITQVNSDGGYGLDFRVDTKTSNTVATTSRMFLSQSGEVGIGTTSPGHLLEVRGTADALSVGDDSNTNTYARFANDRSYFGYLSSGSAFVQGGTGKGISFHTGSSTLGAGERMRIDSNGNVGIGTTSPVAKLDINDSSNDVSLTSTANYAINTGSAISVRHYRNVNLETPKMQWSIGGGTDLNWKKLATIVINDANYAGFGAEVEITDFQGNYGASMAQYGDVYKGGLSIFHRAGTGVEPEQGIITINNDIAPYIRIYKIAGSGNSSYQIQVKSPGNYRQIHVKLEQGNGNQIASVTPHANDTNGSTSGGTAYTPDTYTSGSQFKTAFPIVSANRGFILDKFGIGTTSPGAKLDVSGSFKLSDFTSNSVATTGSLSPNQNYQASTQDTLADLTVDPSGNVVRGMQEGTWTFTKAQLDGTLGMTLISAPGVNKAVIVYESSWMIKYNATGAISANQRYEIRQASNVGVGVVTILPGAKINEILSNGQTMPGGGASAYGFYSRDVPADVGGRTFKTNTATTLHKNVSNQLPTGVETVSIKLRYRIYDATTF